VVTPVSAAPQNGYLCGNAPCLKLLDPAVEHEALRPSSDRTAVWLSATLLSVGWVCCCVCCALDSRHEANRRVRRRRAKKAARERHLAPLHSFGKGLSFLRSGRWEWSSSRVLMPLGRDWQDNNEAIGRRPDWQPTNTFAGDGELPLAPRNSDPDSPQLLVTIAEDDPPPAPAVVQDSIDADAPHPILQQLTVTVAEDDEAPPVPQQLVAAPSVDSVPSSPGELQLWPREEGSKATELSFDDDDPGYSA